MQRLIKLLVLTVAMVWVLAACQSAEPESAVEVFPTDPPTAVATNPPPTEPPLPTEEPEVVAVVEEAVVEEATEEPVIEEVVVEEPAAEEVVSEEPAVEEVAVEAVEEQPAREAIIINGYTNVVYTQNDAELLGGTGKPQLLNVYAQW